MKNPYTSDPDVPYVKLAPADWFVADDIAHDQIVQVREIIKASHNGRAVYAGYGMKLKVTGSTGERKAKFVMLDPYEIPDHVKVELDG